MNNIPGNAERLQKCWGCMRKMEWMCGIPPGASLVSYVRLWLHLWVNLLSLVKGSSWLVARLMGFPLLKKADITAPVSQRPNFLWPWFPNHLQATEPTFQVKSQVCDRSGKAVTWELSSSRILEKKFHLILITWWPHICEIAYLL